MIADFFFGTQNDIFNNPKTTDIKFLISRKFEVTIVPLNRWQWMKYHRFRALNISNHEHSTSKINTAKSALACSLLFLVFVFGDFYRFVLSLPSLLSQSFIKAYQPCECPISNKQQSAVFMLGTRFSRFSCHVWQFVGTCIELELCFSGPKSTLPSLRHRARFQGKVFRYPEAENSDYRQQQQQQVSKFCINWTSRVK